MKKITILLFGVIVALPAFSQSTSVITGKGLELLPIPGLSGYAMIKGTPKVTLSTDITVVSGSTGKISLDDSTKFYKFLGVSKGLTLNYTIISAGTVPVPDPTIPTVTIQATPTGNGGTYTYPLTLSGQKTVEITYALAPGGQIPNATVTFTHSGTVLYKGDLTPTAGWADYQTKSFPITTKTGAGTLTVTINRGLNPRAFVFKK